MKSAFALELHPQYNSVQKEKRGKALSKDV